MRCYRVLVLTACGLLLCSGAALGEDAQPTGEIGGQGLVRAAAGIGDLIMVDRRTDPMDYTPGAGESDNPGALYGLTLPAVTLYLISEPDPFGPPPTFKDLRSVTADGAANILTLHRGQTPAPGFILRHAAATGTPVLVPPTDPVTWNPLFVEQDGPDDPKGMEGIAVDKEGDYVFTVSRPDVRSIFQMTPAGVVSILSEDGTLSTPRGLFLDIDNHIIVSDSGPDAIVRVDPLGDPLNNAEILVQNPAGPDLWLKVRDVSMDSDGNYIVLDEYGNGAVFHVDRDTLVVTKVASAVFGAPPTDPFEFDAPRSVAVHANGNYYVVDRFKDTIFEVAPFPAVDAVTPILTDHDMFKDLQEVRVNRQLTGIDAVGPADMLECSGPVQLTATAFFNDGFTLDLGGKAEWSFVGYVPPGTEIDANGALYSGNVAADLVLTVRGTYRDRGLTFTDDVPITILENGVNCGPIGACCDPLTGVCSEIDEVQCISLGGNYQGDGTGCTPNPCPPAIGACCQAGGVCTPETPGDCATLGGVFQGAGVLCANVVCDACGVITIGWARFDFDDDCDVDLTDFFALQTCYTGPGIPVAPGCECFDSDSDGDVDLADFLDFQTAYTGPGPGCP